MDKKKLFSYLTVILCAVSFLALFFTFASYETTVSYGELDVSSSASAGFSGWTAAFSSFFGWLIPLVPIAILAVTYVDSLKAYRRLGSVGLPILSIVVCYITRLSDSIMASAGDVSGTVDIESSVSAGFGFYVLLLCNLALAVIGVYHLLKAPADESAT